MCDFCDKIYNSEKEYIDLINNHWSETTVLVKDDENNIGIYIPIDDMYYSDVLLNEIKYCPFCKRDLYEDDKRNNL